MPIPFIIGGAALLAGLAGAKKGIDGVRDSNRADEIQDEAEDILYDAQNKMNKARNNTSEQIKELGREKIEASANELKSFVNSYQKIKNINLSESKGIDDIDGLKAPTDGALQEMHEVSIEATDVLGSGAAGIGAGALLGWGTYGGVMALGTASTGTAIAGLSGAAATNATLAWLGGGAIAAGGGGIALGTAVLGGIIAGPALLIAGGIFGSKAKEKLHNAQANRAKARQVQSEIEKGIVELNYIKATAEQIKRLLEEVRVRSSFFNAKMVALTFRKTDWRTYTQEEKNTVACAVKMIQLLKVILDTPLLTKDGILTAEAKELAQREI
ncbi:hypothetical protein IX317_001170 [Fusobacterium sp. DD29]|uniref:hypothetical protein n=1 Tax=unclassified Fusobacterium TaxID=2648384 RepID=UPI001B8AD3F5|nr:MULTISPECIES: hypothetical protein [unclassified Fusobacterium]MBR8749496.1 hypothetical protein [Fusobacterium sp. DD29]MBR8761757.1 hypothetical protein [Fusobacterium sp. DD25]MBR8767775.1 hypothetical protein [Fusobacterium sp. DD43]MBR8771804.1 hypothetical protein [Fusobacterium sp. DD40]MBR8776051.1 hypothetical protein [Fusobacterium sp. DD17]